MKALVINADDLGICVATNRAIARAATEGCLTSASLMANGPAFDDAIDSVVRALPQLSIGLHLCLTTGRSVALLKPRSHLVDSQGRFCHGFLGIWRNLTVHRSAMLNELEIEFRAQFLRAREAGVSLTHVDGHQHVHMIPAIFSLVVRLAREQGVPLVRLTAESWRRRPAGRLRDRWRKLVHNGPKVVLLNLLAQTDRPRLQTLQHAGEVRGVLDSGLVDRATLADLIVAAAPGITEIITHPGEDQPTLDPCLSPADRAFLQSPCRQEELRALCDPGIAELVRHSTCLLTTHRNSIAPPSNLTHA